MPEAANLRRPGLDVRSVRAMLLIPAAASVVMVLAAFALDEAALALPFVAFGIATFGARFAFGRALPDARRAFTTGETLATAAFAWALIALLGTLPFWLAARLPDAAAALAPFASALSALFESTSGFTSTGLTMVDNESELPRTIQLWRSSIEWIGGAGLALLMLTFLRPERDGGDLHDAEIAKPLADEAGAAARRVWAVYLVLTAFAIALFAASGMPAWESFNHGLTGIATGGFSVTDRSFSAYGLAERLAAMIVMVCGAISFAAWRETALERRPLGLFRRTAVRGLFGGIAVATLVLWLSRSGFDTEVSLPTIVFQVISAFSTAGFSSASLGEWHSASLAVLIVCMTIGGASGATTGGVKIDRVVLLGRGIAWRFQRLFRGERARDVDGETRSSERARLPVEGAATLVALWIATWLAGCLVLAAAVGEEWTFTQVAFEVMSAQGGVGLTSGISTHDLAASGKGVLIFLMWAGRLELIAVFALLWLPFARRSTGE